ncbi:MAG: arginine-tRNA-protein transferase [Verrucomicrobiota bacterium]
MPLIWDAFQTWHVRPERLDALWATAWRRIGVEFHRYSLSLHHPEAGRVLPIRIVVDRCQPSESQRRTLRRNADLRVCIGPPALTPQRHDLFHRHKQRFRLAPPEALQDFLGPAPGRMPCETVEVAAYENERLVAASYLDLGVAAVSSIYALFDPALSRRRLGIATMLWEIEFARQRGARFYYPGYAFHEPSFMDYKKQFAGSEWYDWERGWQPLPRFSPG